MFKNFLVSISHDAHIAKVVIFIILMQHSTALFTILPAENPVLSKSTAGAVTENEKGKIYSSRNGKWLSIVKHSATELDTHYISDYHIRSFFPSYYIL